MLATFELSVTTTALSVGAALMAARLGAHLNMLPVRRFSRCPSCGRGRERETCAHCSEPPRRP